MIDEVLEELNDVDSSTMETWFVQFGEVIQWTGSGDDSILPESVRQYLADNHPRELLAIEA